MPLKPRPLSPEDAVLALRLAPDAVRAYRVRHTVDYSPDSPAAADVEELTTRHPDVQEDVVYFVGMCAHSLLVAAEDHMEALARAMAAQHLSFASATIARGAIESAAQAWWLLGPSGGPLGRQARCLSLQLASTYELIKAHKSADDPAETLHGRLAGTRAEAVMFGLEVREPNRRRPHVAGYAPLGPTDLVTSALGGVPGELAYRVLSNSAHSHLHAAVGRMSADRSDDLVPGFAGVGLSKFEVGLLTAWTLSVYLSAIYRWSRYVGWDDSLVDALREGLGVSHLVERSDQ